MKQLGPARLGVMGAVALGMILFFVFVSVRISEPQMTLLYGELNSRDAARIASKLEETQIPYEISGDGTKVMVAEQDVGRSRMLLAEEGLPNGGSLGYELFDKQSGFGQTNFIQNVNQVRALEGELGRTIASIDNVRSARVHLVLPQRKLFSRQDRPPSASVFLNLSGPSVMAQEQVLAIQSLVASAVPELDIKKVAIIDQSGNLLARGQGQEDPMLSNMAEGARVNFENRLTQSIKDMVGRIVGYGKVQATVTADLDFNRITTNEEIFDPESQIARSTQVIEESELERQPASEEVTVNNNLPAGAQGSLRLNNQPTLESNKVEEITNFEIARTMRNITKEVGDVKKLSVAVLVDGNYTQDADGNKVYEPRSEEELQQIERLVKSAVGFDEMRGDTVEVVNMRFADVEVEERNLFEDRLFGFEKNQLLEAAEIITVAIMIILVVLLVLQPMVKRLLATEEMAYAGADGDASMLDAAEDNPALAPPKEPDFGKMDEGGGDEYGEGSEQDAENLINMDRVEGKVKASSVKKIEDIVDAYPTETVSVLRGWMSQES